MSALICGSMAFDTIMTYEGRFADAILPDQIHILNVSFWVPHLRREYGGCAGNIAYNLKALGGNPLIVAAVGSDGADYLQRLEQLGISTQYIHTLAHSSTAHAMIMTDQDNNQITAFHPGAMLHAHEVKINALAKAEIAIISPDGRDAMLQHAQSLSQAKIPFIFDPGQAMPLFNGDELKHFLSQASWLAANDYEAKLIEDRTGLSMAEISKGLRGAVVTLGAQGSQVWVQGQSTHVPAVQASAVVDPTGCGDSYRAALLFGLERGWSLERCAALGNQVGAIKIAHVGTQNHQLDPVALGAV
jgi:adenosine kinase